MHHYLRVSLQKYKELMSQDDTRRQMMAITGPVTLDHEWFWCRALFDIYQGFTEFPSRSMIAIIIIIIIISIIVGHLLYYFHCHITNSLVLNYTVLISLSYH